MILIIDNYDSFTYNLVHYIQRLGYEVCVVRNDNVPSDHIMDQTEGVILSPGPMLPGDAGSLMDIIHACSHKPLLGICLGHQALVVHYGGTLENVQPVHGKVSEVHVTGNTLFHELPPHFNVVRYHSWAVKKLPGELEVLARTEDGQVMAFQHITRPHFGVQFHPESILTQNGIKILENWLIFNQIREPKKMFD